MKKGRWIALVLVCSMLTACGGGSKMLVPAKVEPTEHGTESDNLSGNGTAEPVDSEPLAITDENAVWLFSHRLLQENINETNPVLSPVSAYLALGMVGLGAKGDTLAEFESTMGKSLQMTAANLMQKIPSWMKAEAATGNKEDMKISPLTVANSVWVDNSMHAEPAWLTEVNDIYRAEVYQGVLSSDATKRDINKWIENKTHSLIKDFLREPLDAEAKMALFNTIYFKGEWVSDFEKNSTYKEDFTTTDGSVKKVDMMHDYGRNEMYLKNEVLDGVVMDYRNGSMAMVALKPTAGQTVREMYENLTYEALIELWDTVTYKNINLKLPKFEVEFDKSLNKTLQNMGLKLAFDSEKADFTGLGYTDNGLPLYISLVRQKAVVKLDEEGTEAAAVTMVVMNECTSAESTEKPIDVFFDEPFLYIIMDMKSRTPLFMGIMDDPS
ncbi:MAG: serpin family protein [Lachnospiraceae bacterium]|nr:serpin family protein [Lachnospiraceae bacterium]